MNRMNIVGTLALLLIVCLLPFPGDFAVAQEPLPVPEVVPVPDLGRNPEWPPRAPTIFFGDHEGRALGHYFDARSRGFLGVHLVDLTAELCQHFGVAQEGAVMISKIVDESPAATAGMKVGDIVTGVDSKPTVRSGELRRQIGKHDGGEIVTLEIWRDGHVQSLQATLDERKVTRMDLGDLQYLKLQQLEELEDSVLPEMPEFPEMPELGSAYREALERVEEALKDEKFLKRLQENAGEREYELQQRLKEMEKRLQELEQRLR